MVDHDRSVPATFRFSAEEVRLIDHLARLLTPAGARLLSRADVVRASVRAMADSLGVGPAAPKNETYHQEGGHEG